MFYKNATTNRYRRSCARSQYRSTYGRYLRNFDLLLLSRTEGLPVNLPGASSGKTQDQTKIVVSIDPQGSIALNRQPTDLASLTPKIEALGAKNEGSLVVINADEKVGHGQVVAVMDRVRQIPGVKMGIATKRK